MAADLAKDKKSYPIYEKIKPYLEKRKKELRNKNTGRIYISAMMRLQDR